MEMQREILAGEVFRPRIEIGVIREDINRGCQQGFFLSGVIDGDGASIFNRGERNFAFIEMDRDWGAQFELVLASIGLGEHEGACAGLQQDADEAFLLWFGRTELLGDDESDRAKSADRSLN